MYDSGLGFTVAASRMGFISKPKWCYTNKLVNVSIFPSNYMTTDTVESNIVVLVMFGSKLVYNLPNPIKHFACESV
jgi:hypothetical protein